jgi:hypothetical protein
MIIDYDYDYLGKKEKKGEMNLFFESLLLCNLLLVCLIWNRRCNRVITGRAFDSCVLMELGHRGGGTSRSGR